MENQNNTSKLKAIIVLLLILLAASVAYMYKMSSDSKEEISLVTKEKEDVMRDLEALKATYDAAIAENTSMSDELIAEREKVVKLMDDLKKANSNVASLSKYRDQYRALEKKMQVLMQEVEVLKKENAQLTSDLDSTRTELSSQRVFNDTLVNQNEKLARTVEKASKLSVLNLRTEAIKERNSGKQIVTEKARRANKLKICFTIAENSVAKSGDKTYYIQVIDSKNNVVGEKTTTYFGDFSLTYSFTSTVAYANKTVDVCEYLAGSDFEKGTYFVNIFDKETLVSKTSFQLK